MAFLESPEFGVGDFILLDKVTEDAFLANLKLRFQKVLDRGHDEPCVLSNYYAVLY